MSAEAALPYRALSEVADVAGGVTLGRTVPDGASVELPYLRVANVQDGYIDTSEMKTVRVLKSEVRRFALQRGDVLLTEGGDFDKLGRGAVWDGRLDPCLHQNHVFRVRCNPGVLLPEYLATYLASQYGRRYFLSIAKQTTNLATISSSDLKAAPVPLRPLSEQQYIVETLSAFADQEQVIGASIAKLRTVRRGAHLSLVSAMDSPITEGASWSRILLQNVVSSAEYGISEALVSDPTGVPVLRMNNIQDGRPEVSDLRYCPVSVPKRLYLRHGDVLFNRTNSIEHIGKSALWRDELPEASFASYLVRLNPDQSRLLPEYLVEWLMHPVIRQRVRSISTVAVQQVNVNPSRLRELEIDFPDDLAEQRRIVSTLASFDDRIGRELDELSKLRKLKRGLIGDLLSGKVRLRDVA
jgi:type I restriction enzyme S subunit